MALQQNSYSLNTNYSSNNTHHSHNASTNNNLNKNFTLPLTIIPITENALIKQQQQLLTTSATKAPDLTFHCMCCEEYFVNPFHMYEHLNTKHADLPEPQESEEDIEDAKDYSWVFEPVCELVSDDDGGKENTINGTQANDDDGSSSSSTDSDSDDDSSTTSSSSTSSSSSSSNSNVNTNTQDEATRDAMEVKHLTMDDTTNAEVMVEAAYEEVEAMLSDAQMYNVKLEPADARESSPTPVLVLNPAANTTITPVLSQVKRGRGRRSAAQQAAIEMSSLISGEPKCFQCSHCEASFPSAGDLSKHVRCHITNKPFQCSICHKTFTHIGSLNTHIRIHSGEKPYKCELCSKAFTQSSSLMVHVRSHSIKKPHQCHLCDKGFVNSTSLAIHLKTHNEAGGGTLFQCTECDKTFKLESQLNEHLRMHTLSLVYQCSICRSAFASSSELVQHMKCHMGEKPFTCSICDRAFTQSGSLNIHMRIHTGEKPFNCKFCNKSFTQASSLSVHMKIHSGDKPFPCHICGKSYSQSAYLNKHIQNHLEDQKPRLETKIEQQNETLLCIVCGELHRDANSLALHVTQKHAALLNTMQGGHANNCRKMEITEEERFKQEQMYMQQIQMLMQMQQQMIIKQPMTVLQQPPIRMPIIIPDPMITQSKQQDDEEMADDKGDEGDGEEVDDEEEENEMVEKVPETTVEHKASEEDKVQRLAAFNYRNELAVQMPVNEVNTLYHNNESVKQHAGNINNENPQYLQTQESSNDSQPAYSNSDRNENSSTNNSNTDEYNRQDHTYEAEDEEECREEISPENGSSERHSLYYNNEIVQSSHNIDITTCNNGMDHILNGSPDRQVINGVYINKPQPMCENGKTESVYTSNAQEYTDDTQSPPNHNGNSVLTSPEYQQDYEEDNINYVTAQSGVIQLHQSTRVEYQDEPDYKNDNGVDMEDMQHQENQSAYSVNDSVGSDINGDIEMSDYPFVDDTKFNFYDDYAAEEEVETAE